MGPSSDVLAKSISRRLVVAVALGVVACGLAGVALSVLVAGHATFHDFDPTTVVLPFTMAAVGVVIVAHVPRNPVGWLFLALSCVVGVEALSGALAFRALLLHQSPHLVGVWAEWVINWLGGLLFPAGLVAVLMMLIPTGRLPSPRWHPVVWAALVIAGVLAVSLMFDPATMKNATGVPAVSNPLGARSLSLLSNSGLATVVWVAALACGVIAASAPPLRFRGASGEERQQLKWIGLPLAVTTIVYAVVALGPPGVTSVGDGAVGWTVVIVGYGTVLPVAIGVAIVKYRLYSIDVAINRTVVYAILAAFITAVYLAVAVGFGSLVGSKSNLGLSLVGVAVVAAGFQPVRVRAQRLANRVVYGTRATPYEALADFSDQAAGTYAIDEALPQMARVVAEGTRALDACVWLREAEALIPVAVWPPDSEWPTARSVHEFDDESPEVDAGACFVPVCRSAELLGALSVRMRPAESIKPVEMVLLTHLAGQAGLFLKNAGLTADLQRTIADLQASRRRIVHAEDEARRRIERDLHDGAQQQIVALAFQLAKVEKDLLAASGDASTAVADLRLRAQQVLDSVRELAHGVYPPLLADRGLGAALRAHSRRVGLDVTIEAKKIPRYPAEVESAVYFCVLEALQNAQKHSHAHRVQIRLTQEGDGLTFSVSDDGKGFDIDGARPAGTGLASMTDRIAAEGGTLTIDSKPGGGTTIRGHVPMRDSPRTASSMPDQLQPYDLGFDSLLSLGADSNGYRRGQPPGARRRSRPSLGR
ncbi:MAG TPA: sensor histidine kinase [Acidimicrobiales bacterium]|nr:sensor histidine kinase [Acidimicrobiales bacterium]